MVDLEAITAQVGTMGAEFGFKIAGSLAILFIGMMLARMIRAPLKRLLERSKLDATISNFLGNLAVYAIYAFVLLAALSNLGFETTSFVALIGAAGLAFGLALEGALGNLASGVLIAIFRPFGVGDWVACADVEGEVTDISIVTTTLVSLDNETFIVPNGEITNSVITNYSSLPYLRVEVGFKVGYENRLDDLEKLLMDAAYSCDRVLKEPAAEVQVTGFTDTGLELQLEVSTLAVDREDVMFDVGAAVKRSFDQHKVVMPASRMVTLDGGSAPEKAA